jgi:hypothetical protein
MRAARWACEGLGYLAARADGLAGASGSQACSFYAAGLGVLAGP